MIWLGVVAPADTRSWFSLHPTAFRWPALPERAPIGTAGAAARAGDLQDVVSTMREPRGLGLAVLRRAGAEVPAGRSGVRSAVRTARSVRRDDGGAHHVGSGTAGWYVPGGSSRTRSSI